MAEPQEQRVNLSEEEKDLLQVTFKDNEGFLQSIRALFFGLETTPAEREQIRTVFQNPELRAIFSRRLAPALDRTSKIGQVQDVWLGAEQMVFSQSRDTIQQALEYKERAVEMTRHALGLLEDPDKPAMQLDFKPSPLDPLAIGLLARNQFIRHVEQQLLFIWVIANTEVEKPTARAERIHKNEVE